MSRYLLLDVGAGTLDILYYDDFADVHYKAVVRSPVALCPEVVEKLLGNLVITGVEMGGGSLFDKLSERAREFDVAITSTAAQTLSHNPDKVHAAGIRIVSDSEAARLEASGNYAKLTTSDLPLERIEKIVSGFGVPFEFDVVGACAQDHGVPGPGQSHLDFRHHLFRGVLDGSPFPEALLYDADTVPPSLNRLRALARSAQEFTREVYVMDSGMAAIRGASLDPTLKGVNRFIVLDVATSHTVCAAMEGDEIAGFFEYHTRDITLGKLESLIFKLAEGALNHEEILSEGGHGAYIRANLGFDNIKAIVATGPKRHLLRHSSLPITWGAPMGDNMMTGTAGLLESIRRKKGYDSRHMIV